MSEAVEARYVVARVVPVRATCDTRVCRGIASLLKDAPALGARLQVLVGREWISYDMKSTLDLLSAGLEPLVLNSNDCGVLYPEVRLTVYGPDKQI